MPREVCDFACNQGFAGFLVDTWGKGGLTLLDWLRPGGYLLAIVGSAWWTGTEDYLGADMFWDHADTRAYLAWFAAAGLTPRWHRYIPEGNSGHMLILAT